MEEKITAWIARDKSGNINIFRTKPSRFGGMSSHYLGEHFCPDTPDYYWGNLKLEVDKLIYQKTYSKMSDEKTKNQLK